jgi:AbrB family looped-hinge helix DNA binding protein
MPSATLTSKGQITVPKEVREALSLEAGHRVAFVLREDGVVEMRPETVDLMSLFGAIKPRITGVTLEDMDEAIRRSAVPK